jgi:hypothetical protein
MTKPLSSNNAEHLRLCGLGPESHDLLGFSVEQKISRNTYKVPKQYASTISGILRSQTPNRSNFCPDVKVFALLFSLRGEIK